METKRRRGRPPKPASERAEERVEFKVRAIEPLVFANPFPSQASHRQGVPMIGTGSPEGLMRLPVPLPSLKVAWLEVPSRLTGIEFQTLINTLTMLRDALVAPQEAPTSSGTASATSPSASAE